MSVKNLFGQFSVIITLFLSLTGTGMTSAATPDEDLIKAAFDGQASEVKRLLDEGANVNAKRENGMTALMGASLAGYQEVVELLLARGAEVDARVYFFGRGGGATAYDLASQKEHRDIMRLLIRAGANHEEKAEVRQETKNFSQNPLQPSRRRD
jgi:ankyrin repeat protein